jgi:hypothetical protein
MIHALRPSLQRSAQNRDEPRRVFPLDAPHRGSMVIVARRLCPLLTLPPGLTNPYSWLTRRRFDAESFHRKSDFQFSFA